MKAEELFELCKKIVSKRQPNFSGIGLVVYDSQIFDPHKHCDLRPDIECLHYSIKDEEIIDYLNEISDYHNTLHDGFHMVNEEGILTDVAQYFVPPIVKGLYPNQYHGVRFHSSLCGSTMEGVLLIAVICSNESIYILQNGKVIFKEEHANEVLYDRCR